MIRSGTNKLGCNDIHIIEAQPQVLSTVDRLGLTFSIAISVFDMVF